MVVVLLILMIVVGVAVILVANGHRRRSRENGRATGSLLWHFLKQICEAHDQAEKIRQQREAVSRSRARRKDRAKARKRAL